MTAGVKKAKTNNLTDILISIPARSLWKMGMDAPPEFAREMPTFRSLPQTWGRARVWPRGKASSSKGNCQPASFAHGGQPVSGDSVARNGTEAKPSACGWRSQVIAQRSEVERCCNPGVRPTPARQSACFRQSKAAGKSRCLTARVQHETLALKFVGFTIVRHNWDAKRSGQLPDFRCAKA